MPRIRGIDTGPPTVVQDNTLRIECSACDGKSETSDMRCIKCMMLAIIEYPSIKRIVLRKELDRLVEGEAVNALKEFALVYSIIRPNFKERRGGACSSCPASPSSRFNRSLQSFPSPDLSLTYPQRVGRRCKDCLSRSEQMLERARRQHTRAISKIREDGVS